MVSKQWSKRASAPGSSSKIEPTRITPQLYAGGVRCLQRLHPSITHVLCLGKSNIRKNHTHYKTLVMDLEDGNPDHFHRVLFPCLEFLNKTIQEGGVALVHCTAGVSRTGAVLAAHLMNTQGLSYNDAVSTLRASRPQIQPNVSFAEYLLRHHPQKDYLSEQSKNQKNEWKDPARLRSQRHAAALHL